MTIPTVLVLPYPAQGHVNPMIILSQKLVENGCKVIFVNTEINHKRVVSSMVEQQHSLDESQIKLVSIPDGLGPDDDRNNLGKLCDAMLSTLHATLEKLIEDIHLKGDNRISFIVADLCMAWVLDVGGKFGIKGAIFWPASAAVFALICNIPKLIDDGIINSDGLGALLDWVSFFLVGTQEEG
ncbi:UDP-glycosyltransferase 83A1 isoform X1 [Cajanus cajan]|uniref:UDP-glycosyltransferase 83A1 isoform X1 n=1 Tax=Cajanus cajan TaxID=3821 RepID=UPI0010FB6967|nr:UDP-glycosyltransferase 83A1 isoform X1 [Cajanus cajan]